MKEETLGNFSEEELDEFACIKAFDEAMKNKHEFIRAEDVFKAIEKERQVQRKL